jgi:hypothetical protein
MLQSSDLQHLADHGFVVIDNFISSELQDELLEDVRLLRESSKFHVAKIGHNGQVQDEQTPFKDIRFSETCFIGRSALQDAALVDGANTPIIGSTTTAAPLIPTPPARDTLYQLLDQVREKLSHDAPPHGRHTHDVPILDDDLEELMYAYYPPGGYYRRHRDAEPYSMSNWRKYSLLLYLNRRDWSSEMGGQLRLHRDSGGDALPNDELPNFIDVSPRGGTLVLFRSDLVPHEVLDTQMDRIAIVGWFLSKDEYRPQQHVRSQVEHDSPSSTRPNSTGSANRMATTDIDPNVLTELRALRDACPRLQAKLEPKMETQQSHTSGMLSDNDLFWFPESLAAATAMPADAVPTATTMTLALDDTDPNYWKSIAAFDCHGSITTLSLSGQRLRHLLDVSSSSHHPNLLASLSRQVVTLDLGNTDLGMSQSSTSDNVPYLVPVLQGILSENTVLKQLHLGGNSLRHPGPVLQVLSDSSCTKTITTLDLRYNDMGPEGIQEIANSLQSNGATANRCYWQVLYLEGNQVGDDGAIALADALSNQATTLSSYLRELYLGQNDIGPVGATALAKCLAHTRLRKLYLEGNRIGSEGAKAFIEALQAMDPKAKTLEKLYVDNNGIDKREAVLLGKSLNSATMMGDGGLFQD